jgi:GT2 family glycosyltransferase
VISYVLPTRDRPGALRRTLAALGRLDHGAEEAEVLVADNGSCPAAVAPPHLRNGVSVRVIRLESNEAAAARNRAAHRARGDWLVMLDDDSHPLDTGFIDPLAEAGDDVAAVGAEVFLADGSHEAGGLPEVYVGCGAAVRRGAFLAAGGYDPSFGFYAEEYDLCARLLAAGARVVHDPRFRVLHEKTPSGRDMTLIVERLVRNNGWVHLRYAPDAELVERLRETILRYGEIARRESAVAGWLRGLVELAATHHDQPRRPLSAVVFDRFTGLAHVRASLSAPGGPVDVAASRGDRVAVVDEGKHCWAVFRVLGELGCRIVSDPASADLLVIGTLSPGPMLDALEGRRGDPRPVVAPWSFGAAAPPRRRGPSPAGAPRPEVAAKNPRGP